MSKIKVYSIIVFVVGLVSLSLGILLVIKANFGVSVVTSLPYVLSLNFDKITFGQWNYIIQGSVLLLLIAVVRKLTLKYLMSFAVSFAFGVTIDLLEPAVSLLSADTLLQRGLLFLVGCIAVAIGVASLIMSNFPILPFDTFIKEVTNLKNIDYAKFKTSFDITCFTISVSLSFLFFGEIRGIHVGTFVSAMILGMMIGMCIKIIKARIHVHPVLEKSRIEPFLEYDLIEKVMGRS